MYGDTYAIDVQAAAVAVVAANDTINGDGGNDTIYGEAYTINAGAVGCAVTAGSDTIDAGDGADTVDGGQRDPDCGRGCFAPRPVTTRSTAGRQRHRQRGGGVDQHRGHREPDRGERHDPR